MKQILHTPLSDDALRDLSAGDIVYLTGIIATCRDAGHHRVLQEGVLPASYDFANGVIFHAGPIVKEVSDGTYEMISVGPTTSRRMEQAEADFLKATGAKMIIGKGGMGEQTTAACAAYGAVHCAYPGGCAVLAAEQVEHIEGVEWPDLGMPEALWILRVKEFGPLTVTIDTKGNNLFLKNRELYQERLQHIVHQTKGSTP